MKNNKSGFKARMKSFGFAISGLGFLIRSERNARIHVVVGLAVVFAGFYFEVSQTEWVLLSTAIILVLITEAINTAIELFADVMHPEFHEQIGRVKDLCAAAVLLSALYAVGVGIAVFGPPLWSVLVPILTQ